MFERRVKIFLLCLILLTIVLLCRALQLQVIERKYWTAKANDVITHPEQIETSRGRLLDRRGRPIAEDVACIDACVEFAAIRPETDEKWLRATARWRLRNRLDSGYLSADRAARSQMLDAEIERVKADLQAMWVTLARYGGKTIEEIAEIRNEIIRDVEMGQRHIWYSAYRKASDEQQTTATTLPWYQRLLTGDDDEGPNLDDFWVEVAEQSMAHPILRAIDPDTVTLLGKERDRFPGLVLRPSVRRGYPYGDAAAHLIGHLSTVSKADLDNDPYLKKPLRQYRRTDLIGRSGLESLCEPLLRGIRGEIQYHLVERRELSRETPVPGIDVATSLDIELQEDLQQAFRNILLTHHDPDWQDTLPWMPGAAVVIDVPTGEVLAMASYPSFDLNRFEQDYRSLRENTVDRPLMNRATQFALEPGSTVKPIVGLGAMTQGSIPHEHTVECTGYMIVNGKPAANGRCWVASMYASQIASVAHHPIPYDAPHPNGFLSFSDALERSCNIYFETVAEKLGVDGLQYWFNQFGLGRMTGLGVPEVSGMVPGETAMRRQSVWFSGIGQSQVLATPIQMANVAATIARGGIWMRPRLVPAGTEVFLPSIGRPDRVDLKLNPAALAAAQQGMYLVVNGKAGTGAAIRRDDVAVAGKTGSAQAALLTIPKPPTTFPGEQVIQIGAKDKRVEMIRLYPGTHAANSPRAFWYRYTGQMEDRRSHAWYIGYAPADRPRIAFAVMIEYGGSGGATAAQVATRLLDACIKHGYLQAR